MTNDQIKELALSCGFKLKEQPDGNMDLNPYVYDFARVVFARQHSEWISVDEQLPPHNNNEANTPKILGDSKTYGVISVTYDAHRNLWFTYGGDDQIFDITSWMFAPEPPSEVQA